MNFYTKLPCLDCGEGVWGDMGVDPEKLPEDHHLTGYLLEDYVWKETGLGICGNPRFGQKPQILCIKHAEERIGRKLIFDDFKDKPMNFISNGVIDLLFPEHNNRRDEADKEIMHLRERYKKEVKEDE